MSYTFTMPDISSIAATVLTQLRLMNSDKKYVEYYLAPTSQYSDSWVRGYRKGSGILGFGKPKPAEPFEYLQIVITGRPSVLSSEWVGYTVIIESPETSPTLGNIVLWPQAGGEQDAPADVITLLLPHLAALLSGIVLTTEPPREAPSGMF
jgi:hypothetical protein